MKRSIFALLCVLFLVGCRDTGRTLPSATGTIYEMLIVVDNGLYQSTTGQLLKDCMEADMPCLPQMEPYFTLSQVSPQLFDNFLKPTRNILYIDINAERYTQTKIKYMADVYSQPQAVCYIQSPDAESVNEVLQNKIEHIRSWFVSQEIERQTTFYRNYKTTPTREAVQQRFNCEISIPADYILVSDTVVQTTAGRTNLVWAVNDGGPMRRDLLIWSYPYTNPDTYTKEYLLDFRDEILGNTVHGSLPGTYMGTEYKQIPPVFTPITVDNAYCAEIRGLWKMYGGEAMGGAFVEHTRLDTVNQQVVTAEVFTFAPGQKKRNSLRQAEAILYTIKLP